MSCRRAHQACHRDGPHAYNGSPMSYGRWMDTKTYCAACLLAALIAAGPAAAQSLALTYKLESRSELPRETPAPIGRCAGFNWLTAIEACGRDFLARVIPARGEAQP